MPKPKPNEKKSAYISRAIKHMVKKEKMEQNAAVGKAYGMWEHYKKKK